MVWDMLKRMKVCAWCGQAGVTVETHEFFHLTLGKTR